MSRQTVSLCPHCAKPIVVQAAETDTGDIVYGRAEGATTKHVTTVRLDGTTTCVDRLIHDDGPDWETGSALDCDPGRE